MNGIGSPSRYDKKPLKHSNFNSDLIRVASEKGNELDIGSRHSTESKESVPEITSGKELVKRFTAKRASTNLNYQNNNSPSRNAYNNNNMLG